MRSKTSRPNDPANAVTPINASEKIPIRSAVICCPEPLRNTVNISATAADRFPAIPEISPTISNMETIYPRIRSVFCCRYRFSPPSRLSAIDIPIDPNDPAIFPRLFAAVAANSSADRFTSGSPKILLTDSRIPSTDL